MTKPMIAIVGRPNVGKSTLFNRLLKRRVAIEHDVPGVTRDRLHGDMEWSGVAFTLVDTGGLMTGAQEEMDALVSAAAEAAIDQADKVVFVADGKRGITDLDVQIARKVQRYDKPVVLAVTKIDTINEIPEVYDYYSLGLGDPIPVSGASGLNAGDLLDEMVDGFEQNVDQLSEEPETLQLAILGRPNVGKSSLVNKLLGQDVQIVSEIPGTTRDAIDHRLRYNNRDIVLIDTAGLRKKHMQGRSEELDYYTALRTVRALERCNVAAILIDSIDGLTQYERRLIDEVRDKGKGIVALFNKWDLVDKDDMTYKRVTDEFRRALPDLSWIPILFISAKTGQRSRKLLDLALDVHEKRASRIQTAELNEFFEHVIEKYPPPAIKGKYLKIKYVSQIKTDPPMFAFFMNWPELMPDSYRRYLENRLRERYPFDGVPLTFVFRRK